MNKYNDEYWIRQSLTLAIHGQEDGEVPVGALLVFNNQVIGKGWNHMISFNDPTAHAEIIALRQGGVWVHNYRLLHTTLYVTLEPCIMCMGAMIHSRIMRLVYGTSDNNQEVNFCYLLSILQNTRNNHHIEITSGVFSQPCAVILSNFFRMLRVHQKART